MHVPQEYIVLVTYETSLAENRNMTNAASNPSTAANTSSLQTPVTNTTDDEQITPSTSTNKPAINLAPSPSVENTNAETVVAPLPNTAAVAAAPEPVSLTGKQPEPSVGKSKHLPYNYYVP